MGGGLVRPVEPPDPADARTAVLRGSASTGSSAPAPGSGAAHREVSLGALPAEAWVGTLGDP
eukprot:10491327-Alexandrium_andersonii.AAC.1